MKLVGECVGKPSGKLSADKLNSCFSNSATEIIGKGMRTPAGAQRKVVETERKAICGKQSMTRSNISVKLCSEGQPNPFTGSAHLLVNFCVISGCRVKTETISFATTTIIFEVDLGYFSESLLKQTINLFL